MSSSELAAKGGPVFCRECGKSIEDDTRFCRFCGTAQANPVAGSVPAGSSAGSSRAATGSGLENWLRQIFPRHHLQDEFMHVGTIAAFLMALIGIVVGFFYTYSWLGTNFLLGSIALLLFLILRESTLSHVRVRSGGSPGSSAGSSAGGGDRYHAGRQARSSADLPAEAANAESSPPTTSRPPARPR